MVGACYFCTTLPGLKSRVVGWIGVCFFGLGFFIIPRQLFRKGPQFVVDERGLEDRRSRLGLVEWVDILSLSVGEVRQQRFLCLHVVDPEKYLGRLSKAGRIAARANVSLGFSEITIAFSGLSRSTDDVCRFIRDNYAIPTK